VVCFVEDLNLVILKVVSERAIAKLHRGRKVTQRWLVGIVCWLLAIPTLRAQAEAPKSENPRPVKLVVKVLDGVSGLPMWFEFPNIWIGAADDVLPRLNIKGEATFDVRSAKPRELRFLPNWYADCRFYGDTTYGKDMVYSIDEILEQGVVAENVCGWPHAKPTPGVIVFYARHRTLAEAFAL
jgi:hypothetical protein